MRDKIKPGEEYRLLELGEIILSGDEYLTMSGWSPVVCSCAEAYTPLSPPIRRKLRAPAPSTGWIKCSERLPETGSNVWTCIQGGITFIMGCQPTGWVRKGECWWMPAQVPAPPEPEPDAAEVAAERYADSMKHELDKTHARKDFLAGAEWERSRK